MSSSTKVKQIVDFIDEFIEKIKSEESVCFKKLINRLQQLKAAFILNDADGVEMMSAHSVKHQIWITVVPGKGGCIFNSNISYLMAFDIITHIHEFEFV